MSTFNLNYKFINTNNSKNYIHSRPEIWCCTYSPVNDLFAWSDRNGAVNLINFKEFNLENQKIKQQQQQQVDNYLTEDVNGLKTVINCEETVWSLAFGWSKSQVNHKRQHHKHVKRVNTRFNLNDILILAVGLKSGKIRIYDAETRASLFVLRDHKNVIKDLKFTKNGSFQLASVSTDTTIKVNKC